MPPDTNVATSSEAHVVTATLIFNARLDALVCGLFMVMVTTILLDSVRVWLGILNGSRSAKVVEAPFVLSRLSPEEV